MQKRFDSMKSKASDQPKVHTSARSNFSAILEMAQSDFKTRSHFLPEANGSEAIMTVEGVEEILMN